MSRSRLYPHRLLPKQTYKSRIEELNSIRNFYLLHIAEEAVPLYDKYYLKANLKCHFIPGRFMSGMSMNLVAAYQRNDTRLIVDYKANPMASDGWESGHDTICPNKQLKYKKNVGYFGFKIADILSIKKVLSLKEKNGRTDETYEISTWIEHKPTKCNYWHYEIYLYARCISKENGPEGKIPDLVKQGVFSKNMGKNLPTQIMSSFIDIIKWRSEIIAYHIPSLLYSE